MKRTKEFEAPRLIGVLAEKEIPQAEQKILAKELAKITSEYICLPFKVEKKYLKNVITCLKLMDIEGLIVVGAHQQAITEFVKLDVAASEKGKVNVIKRNDNKFVGTYLEEDKAFQQKALKAII
ncbi:MAG: hypothetical protein ABH859_01495 [Pseudomonadota bacterium]